MAITQTIATLPVVLNDSATFYEDIAERNNSLVTTVLPSINAWATQANLTQTEINAKAAQVAAQAVDGGYSQTYINTNFVGVNNAQTITGVKTFTSSPIVPTPTTGTQAVNKDYVDNLKTIATGTATFTATTNNINLTGIGIGVEVGDVIQISGAIDAKNNSEFTVEVITDANNIIVNQAHANKGTTKNVATQAGDTGVTIKLLAKWYNAPIGLGQGWVDVTINRALNTNYPNNTNRSIGFLPTCIDNNTGNIYVVIDGVTVCNWDNANADGQDIVPFGEITISKGSIYSLTHLNAGVSLWLELR